MDEITLRDIYDSDKIAKPTQIPGKKYFYQQIRKRKAISEELLEAYVFKHYKKIWKEVFNENATHAEQQKTIIDDAIKMRNNYMPVNRQIADLYIECESGKKYLVEIKNVLKGHRPYMEALVQLLYYGTRIEEITDLVILSTDIDGVLPRAIKKYNLPIQIVLFGETGIYKFVDFKEV